jgi:hypothetical protein
MRIAFCTALGVAWLAGTGAVPASRVADTRPARAAADSTTLASKLVGKWAGGRYEARSMTPHRFTMSWMKASDGHLTARVDPAGGAPYETNVVWSSDTGFVTESAPHQSRELHEEIVTRTVSHLKGDSLWGKIEMRPTSYRGRTETGHYSATRQK